MATDYWPERLCSKLDLDFWNSDLSFSSSFTYSLTLGCIHDLRNLARGIAEVVKNLARVLWGNLMLNISLNLRLFRRIRWTHKEVMLLMVIKGLNHQVNPLDLVQIKVKHKIWQVQNIRHRSQVTSAGHCSSGESLLCCRPLYQLWNYKMCMDRIARQKHESALEGACRMSLIVMLTHLELP